MKTRVCSRCHGTGRVPDRRMVVDEVDRANILRAISAGVPQVELARRYGVTESAISRIKHRTR